MKLIEALNYNGVALEEATLTQIAKRINKHKEDSESPAALAKLMIADGALKQSIKTVEQASQQERSDFAALLQEPSVSKAIGLASDVGKAISRLAGIRLAGTIEPKKPIVKFKGALASMSDEDKSILQSIQNDFIKAKSDADKTNLIKKWSASEYNSKMLKLARNNDLI